MASEGTGTPKSILKMSVALSISLARDTKGARGINGHHGFTRRHPRCS
jgi:hypothetical protein